MCACVSRLTLLSIFCLGYNALTCVDNYWGCPSISSTQCPKGTIGGKAVSAQCPRLCASCAGKCSVHIYIFLKVKLVCSNCFVCAITKWAGRIDRSCAIWSTQRFAWMEERASIRHKMAHMAPTSPCSVNVRLAHLAFIAKQVCNVDMSLLGAQLLVCTFS